MIVDARGLNCDDSFRRVSSVVSNNETTGGELSVLVDSEKNSQLISGFAEIVLGCDVETEEMRGLYIIKIAGTSCQAGR
jgi:hypothetical protein